MLDDDARPTIVTGPDEAPTTVDRQWLIRLENGEQKSCRELAMLQQWIVSGVVTRESLISRTGKTWKRIGDIADLDQYFTIADEARATRDRTRPVSRPGPIASIKEIPGTIPGYSAAQAAGGTILPDDDEPGEARTTRAYPQGPQGRAMVNTPPPVPTRGAARTPAAPASPAPPVPPMAPSLAPPAAHAPALAPTELAASRKPQVTPPVPPRRPAAASGPAAQPPMIPPPPGNRATAMWATDGVKPEMPSAAVSGPFVGKLSAIPDEPAFAGRVRLAPGDPAAFDSGRVRSVDDDDDVLPARRGSRAGMWVLIMALLVMGAAAAVVYVFVLRTGRDEQAARPAKDAGVTAVVAPPDAAAVVAQVPAVPADAAAVEPSPLAGPRGELAADVEPRLRTAAQALDGKPDAASQALRAHLIAQLAQDLLDRAGLIASPDADNLRKESKQLVLDAATAAQHALRGAADDPGANLAMAEVLRLQAKPARDIKRYLDTARARPDKNWATDLALADAMVLARDGKVEEARAAFAAIDQADGKLETSGDVRARFHLALALAAQGKAAEARPLVDAILAAQPEHAGARALVGKLETLVIRTDPLPPEEHADGARTAKPPGGAAGTPGTARAPVAPAPRPGPAAPGPGAEPGGAGGAESYDRLLQHANAISDSNCAKAMDLYARALELKPNGVEALAGLGYCQIDAKQFSSAFSKFRAALAVSPKYEPALRGIAETYQQQGRKEQAIEAYRRYLEVYPDSVAAKKQLERLGADTQAAPPAPSPSGSGAAPGSSSASAPASPPAPAAPPAPPPAPASDSPGAGSGSG
jgi:tetratricopeptide (TPR) repeat protein